MPLIIWYYALIISFFIEFVSVKHEEKDMLIIIAIIYLSTLEMLARMAKTSPLIPYENSKYILSFFLVLGILLRPIKQSKGWLMLLLIIPAAFYDLSGEVKGYMPIVFNLFGPIDVALAIVYFSNIKMTNGQLVRFVRLLIWTLISSLIFTIVKTPSYDELEFTLSANFSTSGGFGSNQVSSAFGLGFFILFVAWFQNWKLSGNRRLDFFLMVLFLFQAIMTFSRGGVIGGVLGIFVMILCILFNKPKDLNKNDFNLIKYVPIFFLVVYLVFSLTDSITGGMITNRYKGETEGTLAGNKDQTINNITSNRYDIFLGDYYLWQENPIFGVGIGASQHLRTKVEEVIAHVELSRLMAEHGVLGILYFILLIVIGAKLVTKHKRNKFLNAYFLSSLFFIALFTTFHAATRTFISPLLIGLSCITIIDARKVIFPNNFEPK